MNGKLLKTLEESLNMNFYDILMNVNKCDYFLDEEVIKKYMTKKLIEDTMINRNKNEKLTDEEVNYALNYKYKLNPYTITYFKNTIAILKEKTLKLLELVYKLSNSDLDAILPLVNDLDLTLDLNGKLNAYDFERIIKPTIYNVKKLFEITELANNFETYLDFKINFEEIENEKLLYPSTELQYKSFDFMDIPYREGYIPLTKYQKDNLNFLEAVRIAR